jgi:hypothetical protein
MSHKFAGISGSSVIIEHLREVITHLEIVKKDGEQRACMTIVGDIEDA